MVLDNGTPATVPWTYNAAYNTPARLDTLTGSWSGALGIRGLQWQFDASGHLSGVSSAGCTYGGVLTVHASAPAVLDTVVTEDCAGVRQDLHGIALLSGDTRRLLLAYTAGGTAAQAGVLLLSR